MPLWPPSKHLRCLMAKPKLVCTWMRTHQYKALQKALIDRGHDVTRTLTEWMPLDASAEAQLLGAIARGAVFLRLISVIFRYKAVEYEPPLVILDRLEALEGEIQEDLRKLRTMVNEPEAIINAGH